MGWALGMCGGQKRRIQFWLGDHLQESEYNIKLNHQEVGWRGVAWTALAQAGACECGNELPGSIKCGEFA